MAIKAWTVVDGGDSGLGSEEYGQWFTCALLYGDQTLAWFKDKDMALSLAILLNNISLIMEPPRVAAGNKPEDNSPANVPKAVLTRPETVRPPKK